MKYLPKTLQRKGAKPNGKLIDPKTGLEWLGKFLMDFLGNFFKGDKFDPNAEPLDFIPSSEHDSDQTNTWDDTAVAEDYPQPNETDIDKGKYKRHFAKDKRTGRIAEINKDRLDDIGRRNLSYVDTTSLDWITKGQIQDQVIKGYLTQGVASKNRATVEAEDVNMPGLKDFIKDYGQYVNGQGLSFFDPTKNQSELTNSERLQQNKVQEGLFTGGTEYWYKDTEVAYAGPYHIHPTMGPMVGEKHMEGFHSKLVRITTSNITTETSIQDQDLQNQVNKEKLQKKEVKQSERVYKQKRIRYY